jgi:hypothetical protein
MCSNNFRNTNASPIESFESFSHLLSYVLSHLLSPTDLNAVCFKAEEDFEIKNLKKWLLTSESKLRHSPCIGITFERNAPSPENGKGSAEVRKCTCVLVGV